MPRLNRLRRRGRDRGAVAVLVAVLLAGNVLLGMGALAVDVGLYYVEREELQSGADAAAVAVAKVCAVDIPACEQGAMEELADEYADDNAKDGAADILTLCGVVRPSPDALSQLDDCPADPTNLTSCIGDRPTSGHYVEVRTGTERPDGSNALPPVFAGAVTGATGTTIAACSRVAWGPVETGTVKPVMAMAYCLFNQATSNGTVYQSRPTGPHAHGVDDPAVEVVFHWHDASSSGCVSSAGDQMMDGFGWFTGDGFAGCSGTVEVDESYALVEVPQTPEACTAVLEDAYQTSDPITVAIIDDTGPIPGRFGELVRVAGIAQFVVTGWWTPEGWLGGPDDDHEADIHGRHLFGVDGCLDTDMCIYGYFTTRLVPGGTGPLGDPTYGTYYIRTIG